MRKLIFRLSLLLICLTLNRTLAGETHPPVQLELFFSPGCTECEAVKKDILPEVAELYQGEYELHTRDITEAENIALLLAYQKRCDNRQNGKVSLVVDRTIFLSGYEDIFISLFDHLDQALKNRRNPAWRLAEIPELSRQDVDERIANITVAMVIIGGLVDGVNPCAISTLIFFISVLVIAKVNRRLRLLVGMSFISASFVVYTAMGFGFIYLFRQVHDFELISRLLKIVVGLCMIPLAFLSYRDAWRFRKNARPSSVTLQIPERTKKRIHSLINSRIGAGAPIIGGFVAGAGVTILESVCTGQGYIPVLTLLLRENITNMTAWGMLILYNLLFITPLVIVFICFQRGMEVTALINWSRNNLVLTKVLLGIFFSSMALLLLL
jgi:cytochrome c biogenesis protein CcdA